MQNVGKRDQKVNFDDFYRSKDFKRLMEAMKNKNKSKLMRKRKMRNFRAS